MPKILIVDDDSELRAVVVDLLVGQEFDVVQAGDGREALGLVISESPDAVLLDINLPGQNGMDVLKEIMPCAPNLPVIMLTASGDLRTAVEAMRLGAYDYIAKPFGNDELLLQLRRALAWRALTAEVESLKRALAAHDALRDLMGRSGEMQEVVRRVKQVADSSLTVLVQGETGTGKELVARAIHQESSRSERTFVAVDCGAVPETLVESELFGHERGAFTGADRRRDGYFQLATSGTLFLDEIGNLPAATQAKLLRVLQERQVWPLGARTPITVDVRIIAACNVSLDGEVRAGRFREDLYYRLSEFTISLPPLRSRREDITRLASRFMVEASMELKRPVRGFSDAATALLLRHAWPGNVRELRNVVRRAVLASADVIEPSHLDLQSAEVGPGAELAASAGERPEPVTSLPTLKEARERGLQDPSHEGEAVRHPARLPRLLIRVRIQERAIRYGASAIAPHPRLRRRLGPTLCRLDAESPESTPGYGRDRSLRRR